MFVKTVIRQGEKIRKLESDLKLEKEANENLRSENEELNLAVNNYKRNNKEMFKQLSLITDLTEQFDYRKSNSVEILRKIKEVISSDQTIK